MNGLRGRDSLFQDLRYAARMLRRTPAVTAVAVLSLALGIGANTAIFTMIESTLLRPISVRHPERLRLLTWREQWGGWVPANLGFLSPTFGTLYEQRETADGGLMHTDFTPSLFYTFLRDSSVFDALFAFKELGRVTAVIDGSAEPVNAFLVSGDFYRGMDIAPAAGLPIGPQNDVRGAGNQVVLISYEYWTQRFGRSPSVIGKKITLNDVPVTIIGVNPEYFTGIEPGGHFEIWAPLNLSAAVYGYLQHGADSTNQPQHSFLDEQNAWLLPIMGRLKPGVTDARAQSMLNALFQQGVDANPGPLASFLKDPAKRPRFVLERATRGVDYLTPRYDRLLLAVFALAGLVLLIACANVANLLLAKSAARQREISLRLALGAGRRRIARQLLTEGLLLAGMAGVAGAFLGYATRNGIPALLATPWRPSPFDTAFDSRVLWVSISITLLAGALFSLAPIWQSRNAELNDALKDGSRSTASLSKLRIGRALVVVQVCLSVLLLASAELCTRTFTNLRNRPLGLEPKGVLLFTLDPPRQRYPTDRIGSLLSGLQEQLRAIPGVQSATYSGAPGGITADTGHSKTDRSFDAYARSTGVGSRFFETMGIPILHGRAIEERDTLGGPQPVVVNQEFGRHFFQNENSVGRTLRDSFQTTYQIVGVCADWHADHLRDPIRAAMYGAEVQAPRTGGITFEVRIAGGMAAAVKRIREVVRSTDPNLAVTDVRTEVQEIDNGLAPERLLASLAAVFAILALILAAIGIYGVMAYAVARRTNEIGIRVALGAKPVGVAWMVLRETLLLAGLGAALGVPAMFGVGPLLDRVLAPAWKDSFLYGLKNNDPSLMAAAVVILVAVGILAGYLPARRAAQVDPMTALRHD